MDIDDRIIVFLLEDIERTTKELHKFIKDRYPDNRKLEDFLVEKTFKVSVLTKNMLTEIAKNHDGLGDKQ